VSKQDQGNFDLSIHDPFKLNKKCSFSTKSDEDYYKQLLWQLF